MHLAKTLRWLIVAAASLVGSLAFAQSPARISFVNLPMGDTLHVYYGAAGCFYSEAAVFIYKGSRRGGAFDVTEVVSDYKNRKKVCVPRGSVFLDSDEPSKLDALLHLYRATPPEGLMTLTGPPIPSLYIEQRRGFRVIATERLHDKQIPASTPVLDFQTMLAALRRDADRR